MQGKGKQRYSDFDYWNVKKEVIILGKTLLFIDVADRLDYEENRLEQLKQSVEFQELINHPRVYFNDDELFYYEEDLEELKILIKDQIDLATGYDIAWGYADGYCGFKVDQIELSGNELIREIKNVLEEKYRQNIKPNFDIKSFGKEIMIKRVESILEGLKNDTIQVTT